MGCDIHMHLETRWRDDKEWRSGLHIWDDNDKIISVPIPIDRNYTLFAVLAGVRNYDDLKPISEPRGLPDDVSDEVRKASDDYGVDGHSHSWLTLDEIKSYEWKTPHTLSRMVDAEAPEIAEWINSGSVGRPPHWAMGIFKREKQETVKEVSWTESVLDDCREFVEVVLPFLSYLGYGTEKRVVFWFDN